MTRDGEHKGRFLEQPRHVLGCLRLLVFAGLVALGTSTPPDEIFLYWFVTIVYGATVVGYLLAGERELAMRRVRHVVVLFDVLMVCGLLVLRGHEVQSLVMAYAILVFLAAMMSGIGNAVVNALVVAVFYTMATSWGRPLEEALDFERLGSVVFFFVIAVFMGHLASRSGSGSGSYAQILGLTAKKLKRSTAQLRQAREMLRANERLCTLGMLSAGIAHEIKNPVAAILASVQESPAVLDELQAAVESGAPTDELVEELRSILADCQLAGEQLQRIALDLNDMVRGGASQIGLLDPLESLQGAARMLRKSAGQSVEIHVSGDATLQAKADPGRLLQVLLNLAGNALDAMRAEGGGNLHLTASDLGRDRVLLEVRDDGPGIPAEVQERMYDPFFTTKGPGQGTGLGLHLVREIVQAQGGSIRCESNIGDGTTFRVELPAASEAEKEGDRDHVERAQEDAADRRRRGDHPSSAGAHAAA